MDILELSYQHLPDHLKPCLLYLGEFPEDQEIPISRLIWLWMAEGFVQTSELKSLDDVAEDYLMDLIDKNLVLVAKQRSMGSVRTCHLHDLLHEFCVAKTKKENFLQLLQEHDEHFTFHDHPGSFRRLCIQSEQNNFVEPRLFCPLLRSLLFFAQHKMLITMYDFSFIFRIFKVLRVLDMAEFESRCDTFPSELELLILLRYLAFKSSFLKSSPSSIANLHNLETFLVKGGLCGHLSLPATIFEMKKMRHLHISGSRLDLSQVGDIESSSYLSNLNSFSTVYLPCEEKIFRKIPNLRILKCRPYIQKHSKTNVTMNFLSQLEFLKLYLSGTLTYNIEVCFPLNLKKLTLYHFKTSILSDVGKLPNLEVLKLDCGKFSGKVWDMKDERGFPKLRILKLKRCDIVRWTTYGDHLPCLEKLVLLWCWHLEEVPSCLENCSRLEIIEVGRCSSSVASLREIEEEQNSMGNEDLNILIH